MAIIGVCYHGRGGAAPFHKYPFFPIRLAKVDLAFRWKRSLNPLWLRAADWILRNVFVYPRLSLVAGSDGRQALLVLYRAICTAVLPPAVHEKEDVDAVIEKACEVVCAAEFRNLARKEPPGTPCNWIYGIALIDIAPIKDRYIFTNLISQSRPDPLKTSFHFIDPAIGCVVDIYEAASVRGP